MKSLLLSLLIVATALVPSLALSTSVASAVDIVPVCNSGAVEGTDASDTSVCSDVNDQSSDENPIINIIRAAIQVVSYVTGAAAVILIILSSIRFLSSGGDSAKVAQARSALIYALVGVLITALAQAIVSFVLKRA